MNRPAAIPKTSSPAGRAMATALFVCSHNAGSSQMSATRDDIGRRVDEIVRELDAG